MSVNVSFDPDTFRPLIQQIVSETLALLESERAQLGAKIAYSEPEAAQLLSLRPHQLRDERLRGRIHASVGPGRKILYLRQDLLDYLQARRTAEQVLDVDKGR